MPSHTGLRDCFDYINECLVAIGSPIRPAVQDDAIIVRSYLISFGRKIEIFKISDLEKAISTLDSDAPEAAASIVVTEIMKEIVSRAIEDLSQRKRLD